MTFISWFYYANETLLNEQNEQPNISCCHIFFVFYGLYIITLLIIEIFSIAKKGNVDNFADNEIIVLKIIKIPMRTVISVRAGTINQ